MSSVAEQLEELHPSIWRASQLARSIHRCVDTGFPTLSSQLVGGGWPTGALIELMTQQPGVGEMRLVAPALRSVADRQVVMIQPPHTPQIAALAAFGVEPDNLLWIKSKVSADSLWAAEQVLRSGNYGAVLFWANQMRPESLRRLNLAAQQGESLFFVVRPLAAALDASPSPLRLSIRPAQDGVEIGFVKRRGPVRDDELFLPLPSLIAPKRRSHTPAGPLPVSALELPGRVDAYERALLG